MDHGSDAMGERILGTSEGPIAISDRDTLAAVSLDLARQARRTLDIVSRHLDSSIYDHDAFIDAVKALALRHRHARVRLLVIDLRPLVTQSHRLLDLADRLPSTIAMRTAALQHKNFNEAFLIADNLGYVHRQFSDRYDGVADFAGRRMASALADRLAEMWERGEPDPNFRRLQL